MIEPSIFEDEAARITRPTETYSQRYDNFNNKINQSWENHVNNRMSYLNYSMNMSLITNDKIKKAKRFKLCNNMVLLQRTI